MIGDAGAPKDSGEPVLIALQKIVGRAPEKTTVVFLGDNIYERGMPDSDKRSRDAAEKALNAQIAVLGSDGARGIFIPGNHDWKKSRQGGWHRIKNLSQYIHGIADTKGVQVNLYPDRGCPGPVHQPLGQNGSLIVLDTQWWLHQYQKPNLEDRAGCESASEEEILAALKKYLIESAREQRMSVVAAHHPLESFGSHGGYTSTKLHLFPLTMWNHNLWVPLPVIGTVMVWVRQSFFPRRQDISHESYEHMTTSIREAVSNAAEQGAAPMVYAAGHDHDLQVIAGGNDTEFHLVSGAGSQSKIRGVGHGDRTYFAHAHPGFMALDFLVNGKVRLAVFEPVAEGFSAEEVYVTYLKH